MVSPNQPATPTHSIRIPDEIWDAAVKKAADEGTTVTEVVLKALKRFLRD
jgi:LDH2 family malate/lactate/ureidoglycolate dehydrogenase